MSLLVSLAETVDTIRSLLPAQLQKPVVGIVCGSGLSGLVDSLRNVVQVPYQKIPGFAESTGSSPVYNLYRPSPQAEQTNPSSWA
jgi:purine-nucleoside phosphorylase